MYRLLFKPLDLSPLDEFEVRGKKRFYKRIKIFETLEQVLDEWWKSPYDCYIQQVYCIDVVDGYTDSCSIIYNYEMTKICRLGDIGERPDLDDVAIYCYWDYWYIKMSYDLTVDFSLPVKDRFIRERLTDSFVKLYKEHEKCH